MRRSWNLSGRRPKYPSSTVATHMQHEGNSSRGFADNWKLRAHVMREVWMVWNQRSVGPEAEEAGAQRLHAIGTVYDGSPLAAGHMRCRGAKCDMYGAGTANEKSAHEA